MFLEIIKEFHVHLTSIGLDSQFITAKLVDEKEFQVASVEKGRRTHGNTPSSGRS